MSPILEEPGYSTDCFEYDQPNQTQYYDGKMVLIIRFSRIHCCNFQIIVMEDRWEAAKESLCSLTRCYQLTITLALLVTTMRAIILTKTSILVTTHVNPRSVIFNLITFLVLPILEMAKLLDY